MTNTIHCRCPHCGYETRKQFQGQKPLRRLICPRCNKYVKIVQSRAPEDRVADHLLKWKAADERGDHDAAARHLKIAASMSTFSLELGRAAIKYRAGDRAAARKIIADIAVMLNLDMGGSKAPPPPP